MTYISKFHKSQFTQFTDAVVSWPRLQEQLGQTHFFTSEQRTHFDSSSRYLPAQTVCRYEQVALCNNFRKGQVSLS